MSSAGQIAGGLVGGIIGSFTPAGPWIGAQIGLSIGGYLDPPKGPNVEGPRLTDRSVQAATYGADIPRVYGACSIAGNVIWLEGNQIKETITRKKTGGKGGGKKQTTTTYSYSASFAVGLCKGPIVGVRRIRIAKELWYDAGASDYATIAASNAAAQGFRVYLGTDTQLADARIQADVGVANTPAWRGLAYIVFDDLPLAKYGNTLMGAQVEVEVMKAAAVYNYPCTDHALSVPNDSGETYWDAPCWTGSVFCSVLLSSGSQDVHCITSPDGEAWTKYAMPHVTEASSWRDSASNGSGVVVSPRYFNVGGVAVSNDHGQSWTLTSFGSSVFPDRSAYGNGRFVLIDSYHGKSSVSTDNGGSWTTVFMPRNWAGNNIFPVTYSSYYDKFYVAYTAGSNAYVARSTDCFSWEESFPLFTAYNWRFMAAHRQFIVVGSAGSTDGILVSSDGGDNWVRRNPGATYPCGALMGLASDGNNLVFLTADGIYYSSDLATYNFVSFAHYIAIMSDLCWSGAIFCSIDTTSTRHSLTIARQFVTPGMESLGSVVSQECLLSGLLSAGDIDVSALTQPVHGFTVGAAGALRAGLEQLRAAFPFDLVQHGYQLRFLPRGGSPVATIPQADLDARTLDQSPGVQILSVREMDTQLPRRVTVQHLDLDREYAVGAQYAERQNTMSVNATTIDLAVVLTASEAAAIAEMLLYLYWTERYEVSFSLPPSYLSLEPGDVVSLTTPEGLVQIRLTEVIDKASGIVGCKGKLSVPGVYSPTALGAQAASTGVTTLVPVGASIYQLLDIPRLSSAQDRPSFVVAMTGALSGWQGGVVVQSTDSGANWLSIAEIGPPGATLGTCASPLGVADICLIDACSVLTVTLTQGQLSSVSQLSLFNGANLFAYGAPGRWEILSAQTCILASGKTYQLRDFLRGRYGSEWAMSQHQTGDYLILLNTSDLAIVDMSSSSIGISWLYRGITVDTDISTDSNRAFAYSGVNLKPLAPVYLTGNRDSGGDWALSWVRRTRLPGDLIDYVDAALGEDSESYHVEIYADSGFTSVKRTLTVSTAAAIYVLADQTTDFGSAQPTLYLRIYQLSATVGRGYPLQATLTR